MNNVVYTRYAESSRVNWVTHFATHVDPRRGKQWLELMQPKTVGLILKSLTTEFKFVRLYHIIFILSNHFTNTTV